jgi:hypothetical protein
MEEPEECSSKNYVRCPKCGEKINVVNGDWYALYEDGEHSVTCQNDECEHDFEISTHVSFSFDSPAMVDSTTQGDTE